MEKHVFLPGRRGFTLTELMVVVAIIGVLMAAGIVAFTLVQNKARSARIQADFDSIYKSIEQKRLQEQRTLYQITGSNCSDCSCRSGITSGCMTLLKTQWGKVADTPLPTDPWGNPYLWDENEGEGGCQKDRFRSLGRDGTYNTSDDVLYDVPLGGYTGCN